MQTTEVCFTCKSWTPEMDAPIFGDEFRAYHVYAPCRVAGPQLFFGNSFLKRGENLAARDLTADKPLASVGLWPWVKAGDWCKQWTVSDIDRVALSVNFGTMTPEPKP